MKLWDTVQDIVRVSTSSSIGRMCALKGRRLGGGATRDILRAAIGSWSPLELNATFRPFGITGVCCLKATLEVFSLSLPWSPLEVVAG